MTAGYDKGRIRYNVCTLYFVIESESQHIYVKKCQWKKTVDAAHYFDFSL